MLERGTSTWYEFEQVGHGPSVPYSIKTWHGVCPNEVDDNEATIQSRWRFQDSTARWLSENCEEQRVEKRVCQEQTRPKLWTFG